ncbi:MAG: HD domain-containing protein [Armatimonadetes bacterium]|nr:HD domain-containing protein [Armatimonadota bacterium]
MVTGIADIEMRVQSFEMGADDVIQKPYNTAELNAIVRNITRLNRFRRLADERHRVEQMLHHVSHSYDQTIEGWVRALDLRDRETEGHSSRVAQMTLQLAGMFRYGEDRIKHLWRGALLHDIGKLAISDTILRKPGALTTEERRIMMKHPMHAHEMLYPIEYLRPALNIPVYHHERWDGTGYPFRIKGDEIPFEARLFSVIDVWDALSFDRPYREAWPQDKVRSYIESEAGKHFDPQVVPVFIDFLRQLDSMGKLPTEKKAA